MWGKPNSAGGGVVMSSTTNTIPTVHCSHFVHLCRWRRSGSGLETFSASLYDPGLSSIMSTVRVADPALIDGFQGIHNPYPKL